MNENEKNINDAAEGEPEIVTLLDENDEEIRFELIGGYNDKGVQYFALIPEGSADEDGGFEEYIILKSVKNADGSEELVEIEDDKEFDRIAAIFDDAFDAEYDYDDEN
ncbi:MAG: DUF1292 domain-containing protein [Clostridia bacterium]|nr:DUF1292 domain-containing protein [Clostridia bacterium]